jgi:hypothetical protein
MNHRVHNLQVKKTTKEFMQLEKIMPPITNERGLRQ